MKRRVIKENELRFLKQELLFWENKDVLAPEKVKEIEVLYEVKEGPSFTKILLYVGAILIGAGILSFIASNWDVIGKTIKFLLIIGLFTGSSFTGYKLERNYPKTAKSFYYLSVLIFGAGIFLVEQMFNLAVDFQSAFLWWSLGILPLAWVLKDKWILFGSSIFVMVYLFDQPFITGTIIPYWILLWIAAIYILNDKIGFSIATGFVSGMLPLMFIWTVLSSFINDLSDDHFYIYGLVYLAIGIILIFLKGKIRGVFVTLGYLVQGAAAFALSFEYSWPVDWIYIPFSILYLLFTFYLIKRGSLLSIVVLCVMIFRFYLDISFAFLPKSSVFIIGGIILLGFGFYFEKQRKKGGGANE
jgi:uncharacterized membrane protein